MKCLRASLHFSTILPCDSHFPNHDNKTTLHCINHYFSGKISIISKSCQNTGSFMDIEEKLFTCNNGYARIAHAKNICFALDTSQLPNVNFYLFYGK